MNVIYSISALLREARIDLIFNQLNLPVGKIGISLTINNLDVTFVEATITFPYISLKKAWISDL